MDFELIERHPWVTAAIIGIGALLVYLFFRSRSNAAASNAGYQGGYQTVDPTLAAAQLAASSQQASLQVQANAQTNQLNAQLAAVNIQSNAQIQLAAIAAAVSSQGITATQDVTNRQTTGQVQVAIGAQQATVDQARINADVQISYIDALVAAFGGKSTGTTETSTGISTGTNTQNSVVQSTQVVNTYTPPYPVSSAITPTPTGQPLPGGTQLVATPSYAQCSPLDSACVQSNANLNATYGVQVKQAQADNNYLQCIKNGYPQSTCDAQRAIQAA